MVTDYFARPAVSRSMLETARRSLRLAYAEHVARTVTRRDTPAMLLGRAAHCAILEPSEFAARYAAAPKIDRRTKAGKQAAAEWAEAHQGMEHLTPEQMATVYEVAAAIDGHATAREVLAGDGESETEIYWQRDGIDCKAKLDRWLPSRGWVADLKLTSDPSPGPFARSCANFGYYRQAAWYLDAARTIADCELTYLLVAVRSAPPYEVAVYELHDEDIQRGRAEYDRVWQEVLRAYETGDWRSEWERTPMQLRMPSWIGSEEQWAS